MYWINILFIYLFIYFIYLRIFIQDKPSQKLEIYTYLHIIYRFLLFYRKQTVKLVIMKVKVKVGAVQCAKKDFTKVKFILHIEM